MRRAACRGLGTVDDGAPSSLQLPSGPSCGICLFNVPGSGWQRLAIWSGAVRRVGVIAEMGRARERDAGTHRGGTPALAPTAPLCDAGGLTAFPYFFCVLLGIAGMVSSPNAYPMNNNCSRRRSATMKKVSIAPFAFS